MPMVLVYDEVLGTDEDAAGAVTPTRDGDEHVRAIINRLRPFPRDVVQPQIEFVEGEVLLRLLRSQAGGVLVGLGVIEFDCGEDGVVETTVDPGNRVDDGVGLVGLEGRGDGEAGGSIAVEDVDELLLFAGANHDGAALGVDGEVLAGDDAAAARLAEGLLVDLVEGVLLLVVLEDDDAAGVGADDDIILL